MSGAAKDRILAEYANIIDSFTNLIRSAKVAEEHAELARAQAAARVPGELMEAFVEKLLQSAGALLGIIAELKRNALLNDFTARNAEVAAARGEAAAEVGDLEARYQQAQAQVLQLLAHPGSLERLPAGQQSQQQPAQHPQQQQLNGRPPQEDWQI